MQQQRHRPRHRAAGRRGQLGIGRGQPVAVTLHGLRPVAGIGYVGRQQIELQRQVAAGGPAEQRQAALAQHQIDIGLTAGEDPRDLVDALPPEPAVDEAVTGQPAEARLDPAAGRSRPLPKRTATCTWSGLERRPLEVQPHAVAERHAGDVQILDLAPSRDARRLAEIVVREDRCLQRGGRRHRYGLARAVGRQDRLARVVQLDRAGKEDLRLATGPEAAQGLIDVGRLQALGQLVEDDADRLPAR